jgi:peptide/nickel transport system substrate-binding protein
LQRAVKFLILLAMLCVGGVAWAAPGDCGTLVLPLGTDVDSLSPLYAETAIDQQAISMLYLSLIWIDGDDNIDWSRSLASAVTTTDDQTFTVTLRPWKWSDGAPVTADDVAFYFNTALKIGPTWPGYGAGGLPYIVKSLTVQGPLQFQIVTTHKVNPTWFIYNAISQLTPLPAHVWKGRSLDELFQMQTNAAFYAVDDGPLIVKRLDVGRDIEYAPNPNWQGPPLHFDRLLMLFRHGEGADLLQVESGTLDLATLPNELYGQLKPFPGTHIEVRPPDYYQDVILPNFRNPRVAFFRDVRVRQAMEDAIDQKAIANGVLRGAGTPAYAPVLPMMTQFLSPAIKAGEFPVGYDPAKSRALLAAAGYTPGPDGVMQKNGQRLEFTYLEETGSDLVTEMDEAIQADLRKVGIAMNIHTVEFNQIYALMVGSPLGWEASGFGQPVTAYPSGENSFLAGSAQNLGGYNDATANSLIEQNISSPDPDYLYKFETYISAQQPVIYGPRPRGVLLVSNRLHGVLGFYDTLTLAPDRLYCSAS